MKLLIPGPVTTRPEVRAAMAQDLAPWDNDFRPMYASVRERVRAHAGGAADSHVCLVLQGCGHFATEAAVRTFIPAGGRILIPMLGAYADRMARLAREAGRVVVELPVNQLVPLDPALVAAALAADPTLSHVGVVYSETGSGVIHDAAAIGAVVHAAGRRMILDAVSAFGALPFDVSARPELDALVFTSNKCFEGMPGLGFAVGRIDRLLECQGNAGSWSFDFADVYAQTARSGPGSFRFTPPAQVLAAFEVALDIYDAEGGQPARLARYMANRNALYDGVVALSLQPCLARAVQGPIVMNVHAPDDPAWNLQAFVDALKARGYLISNFYNTPQPSFRVGLIGAITPDDMRGFVAAIDQVLPEIGVRHRGPARQAA
ncbi:MAG: 2-aminoethylphosphonate--pyruvate aminotransferase [Rhodospirillales bacterium 70-18]|nr:2-aminoethylphosphonate--pyruvate transaminase [Rhodospirillales bacterium]OJY70940.1 MAG: 2-aminoethylphosphonate--pyruvate aminotransferase [Rhodospirillales bacterium 70-18]